MPTVVQLVGTRGSGLESRTLRKRANRMLEWLGVEGAELSLLITSDAQIRALNRDHRREDRSTDVLAFPMDFADGLEGAPPDGLLGDVVISMETAEKQALAKGHDLLTEITFLLAHGVLHLIGYDHRTRSEKRHMDRLTRELLSAAETRRAAGRRRALQ